MHYKNKSQAWQEIVPQHFKIRCPQYWVNIKLFPILFFRKGISSIIRLTPNTMTGNDPTNSFPKQVNTLQNGLLNYLKHSPKWFTQVLKTLSEKTCRKWWNKQQYNSSSTTYQTVSRRYNQLLLKRWQLGCNIVNIRKLIFLHSLAVRGPLARSQSDRCVDDCRLGNTKTPTRNIRIGLRHKIPKEINKTPPIPYCNTLIHQSHHLSIMAALWYVI